MTTSDTPTPRQVQFLPAVAFELLLGLAAILLGIVAGPDPRASIPQVDQWREIAEGIGWGLAAAIPLLVVMITVSRLPGRWFEELRRQSREQFAPMFAALTAPQIIVFALTTGICEELLFRGWLQMSLIGETDGAAPWGAEAILGLLLASLVFGMCHFMTPLYFALASLSGIYFGALLIATDNLLVPIFAHGLYDGVILLLLVREAKHPR